jgi:hypothetical protein
MRNTKDAAAAVQRAMCVQQYSIRTLTAAASWFLSKGPRYAAAACAPGKAPLDAPTVIILVWSSPAVVCGLAAVSLGSSFYPTGHCTLQGGLACELKACDGNGI